MVPDEFAPDGHHIELVGELGGILGLEDLDTTKPAHIARARSITLVAGERNRRNLPVLICAT